MAYPFPPLKSQREINAEHRKRARPGLVRDALGVILIFGILFAFLVATP